MEELIEIKYTEHALKEAVSNDFVNQIKHHIRRTSIYIPYPIRKYYLKVLKNTISLLSRGVSPEEILEKLKRNEERYIL